MVMAHWDATCEVVTLVLEYVRGKVYREAEMIRRRSPEGGGGSSIMQRSVLLAAVLQLALVARGRTSWMIQAAVMMAKVAPTAMALAAAPIMMAEAVWVTCSGR